MGGAIFNFKMGCLPSKSEPASNNTKEDESPKQAAATPVQSSAPEVKEKASPFAAGSTIKFLPNNSGSIFVYYKNDGNLPDGDGNMIFLRDVKDQSKVPARKYNGRGEESIGQDIGTDSARFYKMVCSCLSDAKRQKMEIEIIDPNGAPLSVFVALHLKDNKVKVIKEKGEKFTIADIENADACAVGNNNVKDYDGASATMAIGQFCKPGAANLATLQFT